MNLVQIKLLKSKGVEFGGIEHKQRAAGGTHYVAVAVRDGKVVASSSGQDIREVEARLVQSIVMPASEPQWKREEHFLRRMARRYAAK